MNYVITLGVRNQSVHCVFCLLPCKINILQLHPFTQTQTKFGIFGHIWQIQIWSSAKCSLHALVLAGTDLWVFNAENCWMSSFITKLYPFFTWEGRKKMGLLNTQNIYVLTCVEHFSVCIRLVQVHSRHASTWRIEFVHLTSTNSTKIYPPLAEKIR